jgi:hypothetical protein
LPASCSSASAPVAWDYYFIDAGLLALFSAIPLQIKGVTDSIESAKTSSKWDTITASAIAIATLGSHLLLDGPLKAAVDYDAAACSLLEHALRSGEVQVSELWPSPFGLAGWHLFPYYIKHEGKTSPKLADFWKYIEPAVISITVRSGNTPGEKEPPNSSVVRSEGHPFGWFPHAQFVLWKSRQPANKPSLPIHWGGIHI